MTTTDIKAEIETASGKTLAQLEKAARRNLDRDGDPAPIKIKSGMSVLWVANANYGQGWRNGYGIGLYARLQMCGIGAQSIRLTKAATTK